MYFSLLFAYTFSGTQLHQSIAESFQLVEFDFCVLLFWVKCLSFCFFVVIVVVKKKRKKKLYAETIIELRRHNYEETPMGEGWKREK